MQKRTLQDLIDTLDPAWPLVQEWISEAKNKTEILPAKQSQGEDVLLNIQVTTRSPMGAIALETGGLLINHGWLRFLGSGNERMQGNLLTWNTDESSSGKISSTNNFFIIAHDVVGGFFALNGGAFPGKPGTAFYFSPDTLRWENTNKSYSQLLDWALSGDLELFYQSLRWLNWEKEVSGLTGDQGMLFYPLLCTEREVSTSERHRRPIPMHELWHLYLDLSQQLKNLPDGTPLHIHLEKEY